MACVGGLMDCSYQNSLSTEDKHTISRLKIKYKSTLFQSQFSCLQVQGGDSDSLGKQNYHPFYITSDPNGGYGRKIESERGKLVPILLKINDIGKMTLKH